jgi:glutaminyl-peptide cyclotransferase
MFARIAPAFFLLVCACNSSPEAESPSGGGLRALRVSVERTYPHARDAFTEGLVWDGQWLYEGTGLAGQSQLRRVELESGRVEQAVALPDEVFGEGLALVGERFVQLSWQEQRAFVFDKGSFELEREHTYEGEGWGLCFDGQRLVMSNGSNVLSFRDPETFELLGSVAVHARGVALTQLNELECVGDDVYANIWRTQQIARIDPATGDVTAMIDAEGLLSLPGVGDASGVDVLNGIAYVPERQRFLLTGKLWPTLFEVEFLPAESGAR